MRPVTRRLSFPPDALAASANHQQPPGSKTRSVGSSVKRPDSKASSAARTEGSPHATRSTRDEATQALLGGVGGAGEEGAVGGAGGVGWADGDGAAATESTSSASSSSAVMPFCPS
jgi:hypothetical protein